MPTEPEKAPSTRDDRPCWADWVSVRPEVAVPGYWESLSSNCAQWAEYVSVSPLWKEFDRRRPLWSNEFYQKTGGALLARDQLPKFCGKGHDRVQTKIVQMTEGEHARDIDSIWPKEGPAVPKLGDLVRTRVECAFLDGVEFIGTKLEGLALELGIAVTRRRQGRLEGYFAQHIIFEHPVYFRFGGTEQPVTIQCEVQLATLLATQIWEQSHGVYEQWRGSGEASEDWQWNPKDHRFIARQLGHMIHLADGLLVQLRDARSIERD